MDIADISKPFLVEPGTRYFLNESLKQCHIIKTKYYNVLYNIGLFALFIFVLGGILIYKYKGRLTEEEKEQRSREKKQYILEKIQNFQIAKRTAHQELITGLPNWDSEYDIIQNKIVM